MKICKIILTLNKLIYNNMLSNDKIKLLSMADALQIEVMDRLNYTKDNQNILTNITRAIGSIRATIKKA